MNMFFNKKSSSTFSQQHAQCRSIAEHFLSHQPNRREYINVSSHDECERFLSKFNKISKNANQNTKTFTILNKKTNITSPIKIRKIDELKQPDINEWVGEIRDYQNCLDLSEAELLSILKSSIHFSIKKRMHNAGTVEGILSELFSLKDPKTDSIYYQNKLSAIKQDNFIYIETYLLALYLFKFKMGIIKSKMGVIKFKMGIIKFKMGIIKFKMGVIKFKMGIFDF